ncbi:MAG: hypothetical protein K0U98_25935 [Deltaproteobacteria bacterium]|nr:hypothetical protein [Deltaproteobacteria bacterium]
MAVDLARKVPLALLVLGQWAWTAGAKDPGLEAVAGSVAPPMLCIGEEDLSLLLRAEPQDKLVIGQTVVRVGNVFDPEDPEENHLAFRTANRLHRKTRDQVIHQQLLFQPGAPFSSRLLEESERLLRSNRYLYEAEICPFRVRGNEVDLLITTRDVWTLIPSISYKRAGGASSTRFEVEDYNFLGTGSEIVLKYQTSIDRDISLYRYRDPSLRGSRTKLEVAFEDNSDGGLLSLDLHRPFYSLDSRWTSGLTAYSEERVDSLYQSGEIVDQLAHEIDFVEAFFGRSSGLRQGWVQRWTSGFSLERHQFSPPEDSTFTAPPPPGRTLAYPWIGFEALQDKFVETTQLEKIGRTEDLNIGMSFQGRLGWSSSAFGADQDMAVFSLQARRGWTPGESVLILTGAGAGGRVGSDGFENFRLQGDARLFWRNLGRHLFFVRLGLDASRKLDPERQLLLGGDNGLRGYPLRFQDGDRRFLLTLEQRFFSKRHIFKLLRVGGAVFFDLGRAWFHGDESHSNSSPILKDLGLGLRFSSSRSGTANVIHLDVAFPLDANSSIDRVQWLVSTKETF